MAEIYGFLRQEATFGEREVLKLLRHNLPRDFSVYVECPLVHRRMQRFPDFIVVTNYGVVILEVKDWRQVVKADPYHALVRERSGVERNEPNPVTTTREFAFALQETLRTIPELLNEQNRLEVPWGCGVVLAHVQGATLTQLRKVWGEDFVLGMADLGPDIIRTRLKKTVPEGRNAALTQEQLRHIRAAINPTVLIEPVEQPPFILDHEQERLVVEPVVETKEEKEEVEAKPVQPQIFIEEETVPIAPAGEETPIPAEARLVERLSVRLLRGVAGSGKSIVLIQRAKFLSASYPDWKILVLTYNRALNERLQSELREFRNIRVNNFHQLCRILISNGGKWTLNDCLEDWLKENWSQFKLGREMERHFVQDEINWVRENRIRQKQDYLKAKRKGRGSAGQLNQAEREKIFDVLEKFKQYQKKNNHFDWVDVPNIVLDGIENGTFLPEKYDAILIDEAQDFAPSWISVVTKLFKPEGTTILLADDPTQSIYRFFSWKEKGIPVAGRTRWLRVPYRNTRQIYRAAYSLIKDNSVLQELFKQEGELLTVDLDNAYMRDGDKPILSKYSSFTEECTHITSTVQGLIQNGMPANQIAVLNPRKKNLQALVSSIRNDKVHVATYQYFKGLEFKVVFLTQISELFHEVMDAEQTSHALRLMYMAMTRAREYLHLGYESHLPMQLRPMLEFCHHLT